MNNAFSQAASRGATQKLWIVTPIYRDVASFLRLREEIRASADLAAAPAGVEFVVLDDTAGADPETSDLAVLDDVRVITPAFNVGHQRALVFGLRRLGPQIDDRDLVVTMDGDGEDKPTDIPRLLAPLLTGDANPSRVVIAQRTHRSASVGFRLSYIIFRTIFWILTGRVVRSGNFVAYRGHVARRLLLHPDFDLCYSSTWLNLDAPISYIPCARGKRYAGRSRMDYSRLTRHGLRMLMPFTDHIATRALGLFLTLFVGGLFICSVLAVLAFVHPSLIPAWATTVLGFILLASIISLGNFVVLFSLFAYSRSISLAHLEEQPDGVRLR